MTERTKKTVDPPVTVDETPVVGPEEAPAPTEAVWLAHPWVDPVTGTQHWPRQWVDVDPDTASGLRSAGIAATEPPPADE